MKAHHEHETVCDTPRLKYPCLLRFKGTVGIPSFIVLAIAERTGMVVHTDPGSEHEIGTSGKTWSWTDNPKVWELCPGKVILEND